MTIIENRAEQLAVKIESLILEARQKVASVVNTAQVYTSFEIGRYIVEDEQGGKTRAEYGKGVLKRVSERLTERFGKGWSEENLRLMRKFYTLYSNVQFLNHEIQTTGLEIQPQKILDTGLEIPTSTENCNQRSAKQVFTLPWSHYLVLSHVDILTHAVSMKLRHISKIGANANCNDRLEVAFMNVLP